jgi:hypothetical protein
MSGPRWDDPRLDEGGMVRSALWLAQVIGVGGTFTKAALREAFPGIGQIDRRVRDLRDYGWVVNSSTEDGTLRQDEQRLVQIGVPVWDPIARRAASPQKTVSARERSSVLARDDYMCVTCGVSAGDSYPEGGHETATLSVVRRRTEFPGGDTREILETQCKRCRAGREGVSTSVEAALERIAALDGTDRQLLLAWAEGGRRTSTPIDRAWSAYRRLPAEAREAVASLMKGPR